ncbi:MULTISPECIES: NAD(P)H-dependent oxidoreductase subunit E [Hallerella]|uniref:NADH-quinone oxidoreductase subunit NuoE family protein n=1 Tax=Hallerella TaxID=2815788 RepID=UPI0023F119DF|nr:MULTISPECIES: NAD(P)H-dependent oxidoreductase subunit E [Hallerella]MCI6872888.1 NADH-quinone oxidoreductase subunit NuoE [Hallerella sp.]MDD6092724.1 NAD(P)H-dependent oxidoreductase subunit E [Hallerella succinigenes]MDY5028158.1 NAD(P)H-dependent oxidoreductase subunit E [Hallerella succinigenes]
MSHITGAIQDVANNILSYSKGPSPVEVLPGAVDQCGHANKIQKQPTWGEIAPLLETADVKIRIADLLSRYPVAQGALLEVLWVAQDAIGWLPHEAIRWAADVCKCSAAHAYGVATFYTMYKHAPTGRFLLQFCHNISCHLRGAESMLQYARRVLDLKPGETTKDGLFTIVEVECLAACGNAPAMIVNDDFATNVENGELTLKPGECLTPERLDKILQWCRDRAAKYPKEPPREVLGGMVKGHGGHPGAPGATAKPQVSDYAPPSPVLGVNALVDDNGATLTWKGAPEFTEITVEKNTNGTWTEVGKPGVKDKQFVDPEGKIGDEYRMIAVSGTRTAKPSQVCKAKAAPPPPPPPEAPAAAPATAKKAG